MWWLLRILILSVNIDIIFVFCCSRCCFYGKNVIYPMASILLVPNSISTIASSSTTDVQPCTETLVLKYEKFFVSASLSLLCVGPFKPIVLNFCHYIYQIFYIIFSSFFLWWNFVHLFQKYKTYLGPTLLAGLGIKLVQFSLGLGL